jgi:hypothetical protein
MGCDTTDSGGTAQEPTQRFTVLSTQVDGPYFNVFVAPAHVGASAHGHFADESHRRYVLVLKGTTLPANEKGYHRTASGQAWVAGWLAESTGADTTITVTLRRRVAGATLGDAPPIGLIGAHFDCSP